VNTGSTVLGIGEIGYAYSGAFYAIPTMQMGYVARVDSYYGNDGTAYIGGLPFATINAAITAATGVASSSVRVTIWVLPGIYTLSSAITIPNFCSLRGVSLQTCTIQMINVTADTTLLTMSENTRVEDISISLTSGGHYNLVGVNFPSTSSVTAKLRTSIVSVNNSTASNSGTSNVYGVLCSGTGSLGPASFSFNCIKGSTINVYSNGFGNKRGIFVNSTNIVTTRDTNIYVAPPALTFTGATGASYVGVETNDTNNTGSLQLRSTTIGAVSPTGSQAYRYSDILQTTPATITNPTYLASAGIQVGPGVDLVTKTAGGKGFSAYVYPTTLFYAVIGILNVSGITDIGGYLWPGSVPVNEGKGQSVKYPDQTIPYASYRAQQPFILAGMNITSAIAPGTGNTTTITVRKTPSGGSIADTVYTLTFNATDTNKSKYDASVNFGAGDLIHVFVSYTGGNGNTTQDLAIQLDCF
jgi:hypothetical protein